MKTVSYVALWLSLLVFALLSLVDDFKELFHSDKLMQLGGVTEITTATKGAAQQIPKNYSAIQCGGANNWNATHVQGPKLVIAGVQKGGTTGLLRILAKLPSIVGSKGYVPAIGESHFLDWSVFDRTPPAHLEDEWAKLREPNAELSDELVCELRELYASHWNRKTLADPDLIPMEKTPSYICNPHVASLLHKLAPWTKVVIILRNPVERVFSAFNFLKALRAWPWHIKLEDAIAWEVEQLRQKLLTKAPKLFKDPKGNGEYDYKPDKNPQRFSFAPVANLTARVRRRQDSHLDLLSRGMYAEQLVPWLEHFELGNNLLILRYEDFKNNNRHVVRSIEEFVGVKAIEDDDESISNDKYQSRREDDSSETVRNYLADFYRPYNDELGELLGDGWKNIWD